MFLKVLSKNIQHDDKMDEEKKHFKYAFDCYIDFKKSKKKWF